MRPVGYKYCRLPLSPWPIAAAAALFPPQTTSGMPCLNFDPTAHARPFVYVSP